MQEKKSTILVIEDDMQIRKMLGIVLDTGGYKVEESETGREGIRLSASVKPDLLLLDLGLPDIDGKEIITGIREWSQIPIIVLSVRNNDSEIASALNLGADDYVTKPFSAEVLLARINANLRKSIVKDLGASELVNGVLHMNLISHEVILDGKKVAFTPKEYDLLRYLMVNSGKMLTHRQILKDVWGDGYVDNTQYLRVFIGQVREKLETVPALASVIATVPGIGYRMEQISEEGNKKKPTQTTSG